ncbi:MAG: sugar kinase, partial [Candidatus Latescibacteria bacterium]|nr:sugar kinase [Candidatus Latescibacterota bacterium]
MASTFTFKPVEKTKYDIATLGEVMLRIDPINVPLARVRTARIWHGGGETNVGEGLAYAFRMRAAAVTALVDDGIGRSIESQLNEAGIDTSHIIWFNTAGSGKHSTDRKGSLHNGIHFTWAGKGVLPYTTEYYRAHTAVSTLSPGDFDWDKLFSQGVRWFHTGGIFTLIGSETAGFALEAMKTAKKYGTFRSFDLNYRAKVEPDRKKAGEINRRIVAETEFLVGNQSDFYDALGYETRSVSKDEPMDAFMAAYTDMLRQVAKDYPNLKIIGTQLRSALSADLINWGAILYDVAEDTVYQAVVREHVEITDRGGGGDSFCSGVAGSLMMGKSIKEAVDYGAAHG